MARVFHRRERCESCISIDVRCWHREGLLGQHFLCSWTYRKRPSGSVRVRPERDAVVLTYPSFNWDGSEERVLEQRVSVVQTDCHFGGQRAWFVCPGFPVGRPCGRRAALLYFGRGQFACRLCLNLAYEGQQRAPEIRYLNQAQKIRMKLGGSANMLQPFPDKPSGMHWDTYFRLRERSEAAANNSYVLTMQWLDRRDLGRNVPDNLR
jgi:hypothetical protein